MSVIYNTQFVDEKYVDIIEPNLYYDSVLQPGVTFTEKYTTGPAGGIFIHKLGSGGIITPTTPAGDFTDVVTADALIPVVFNNTFRKSEIIYGVTAQNVAYNKAEEELARLVAEVSESWQVSGLASLTIESSDFGDTTTVSDSTIKNMWIKIRKTIKQNKANADFGIVSTAVYESYLQFVGDDFTPLRNDQIQTNGRGGLFYGMPIIEANALGESAAKYYDYTGTLRTIDLTKVDIIMGDHEAFSALNNFELMRVIDSERRSGALAQVEMNAAYRVTNSDRIIVKYNGVPTA